MEDYLLSLYVLMIMNLLCAKKTQYSSSIRLDQKQCFMQNVKLRKLILAKNMSDRPTLWLNFCYPSGQFKSFCWYLAKIRYKEGIFNIYHNMQKLSSRSWNISVAVVSSKFNDIFLMKSPNLSAAWNPSGHFVPRCCHFFLTPSLQAGTTPVSHPTMNMSKKNWCTSL